MAKKKATKKVASKKKATSKKGSKDNNKPSSKPKPKQAPPRKLTDAELKAERQELLAAKSRELAAVVKMIRHQLIELAKIDDERKKTKNLIDKYNADIMELGKEIDDIESGNYQKQFTFSEDEEPKKGVNKKEGQPKYLDRSENYDICLAYFAKKKKEKVPATANGLCMALHNGSRKKEYLETAKVCIKWFAKIGQLKMVKDKTNDGKDRILYYSKDEKEK